MKLIVVGKQNEKLNSYDNELILRIKKLYSKFEIIIIKQSNKVDETTAICKHLKNEDENIILDISGKKINHDKLYDLIIKTETNGINLNFVIGGAEGFDENQIKKIKCSRVKIADLTFNHHLCRSIVLEQIYRMLSIKKGIPYHK